MRKFTTRVVLRKREKKRKKEEKKNTRITRRALVFCAFSLRLLDLDSSGLGALILALPVQQALRRVSLTSFPADADATSPTSLRKGFNKRKNVHGRRDENKEGARRKVSIRFSPYPIYSRCHEKFLSRTCLSSLLYSSPD